jgi:hypothetical protein
MAKHPARKEDLPAPLSAAESSRLNPLEVDLETKYRQLPRLAGTGPSGYRNEYATVLTTLFEDARCRQALQLHERFANDFINGRLPVWFNYLWSSVRLVAPIKAANADRAPDVRPLGIGVSAGCTCLPSDGRLEGSGRGPPLAPTGCHRHR